MQTFELILSRAETYHVLLKTILFIAVFTRQNRQLSTNVKPCSLMSSIVHVDFTCWPMLLNQEHT